MNIITPFPYLAFPSPWIIAEKIRLPKKGVINKLAFQLNMNYSFSKRGGIPVSGNTLKNLKGMVANEHWLDYDWLLPIAEDRAMLESNPAPNWFLPGEMQGRILVSSLIISFVENKAINSRAKPY